MLKLRFKDQRKPAIWLVDARYSIGSDRNNDIVLEDAGVSGYHADIQVEDNDRIFLTDAGSVSGTRVNGQPVQGRTRLRANDVIGIHTVELELLDPKEQTRREQLEGGTTAIAPALQGLGADAAGAGARADWLLEARTGSLSGQRFDIPGQGTLMIGRSRDCDLVLPGNHVSRHHAELYLHGGQPWVRDLDSSNGTYVNRQKVREQGLRDGDELRFDTLVFAVRGPERDKEDEPASAPTPGAGASTRFHGAVAAGAAEQAPGPEPAASGSGPGRICARALAGGGNRGGDIILIRAWAAWFSWPPSWCSESR